MYQNNYAPEGLGTDTALMVEYLQSDSSVEKAIEEGIIFRSRADWCDSNHNLHVSLPNGRQGIIPFSECVADTESSKPISAISRVGKSVCFKITENRQSVYGESEIILSRKAAQAECMENYISRLSAGQIIQAKITHLEQFGAFCDIGCGIISLLPIDCMSVSRISHPKERFENGQNIFAVVKNPCDELGRLTLSHKELLGTWEENANQFCIGQTVTGVVRSIEEYGVFVELTPNLAGLAELTQGIKPGDCVSVFIKSILPQKMKIKLVIIDKAERPLSFSTYDYYMTEGSINRWQYSPEGSVKFVESVF